MNNYDIRQDRLFPKREICAKETVACWQDRATRRNDVSRCPFSRVTGCDEILDASWHYEMPISVRRCCSDLTNIDVARHRWAIDGFVGCSGSVYKTLRVAITQTLAACAAASACDRKNLSRRLKDRGRVYPACRATGFALSQTSKMESLSLLFAFTFIFFVRRFPTQG